VHEHTVHFHQVDKKTRSRIRYEKVAEKSGKEVDASQIELGYEMGNGDMVLLESEELDELRPSSTRTIDIADFVELSEVDPVFYSRTYWLAPDGDAAVKPYRLLVAAMQERQRAGIGMVVMRNKQYLAAIRSREGALALSTMHFADEVLSRSDVSELPAKAKPNPKELTLATQIIDSMSGPWKPQKYHDTYAAAVRKLIRAHEKGNDVVVDEPPATEGQVIDLMEALQASVKATAGRGDRAKALSKAAARLHAAGEKEHAPGKNGTSRKRVGAKASKRTKTARSGNKSAHRTPRQKSSARKSA
jgi:DNA end-binding protein Ku